MLRWLEPSSEPISATTASASFNDQAEAASDPKLVLPITGGSSSEPANKKQKKEAQRRVQHVGVQGPFIKSRCSHIPITFSQEDLQLKDYPHNDAMVISCVIKGFLFHNVLVDKGSAADHAPLLFVPLGKPPTFDGEDYARWSDLMRFHLISLHKSIWDVVEFGAQVPSVGDKDYDICPYIK